MHSYIKIFEFSECKQKWTSYWNYCYKETDNYITGSYMCAYECTKEETTAKVLSAENQDEMEFIKSFVSK